ncbi:hypothetical protein IE53DRAFT_168682 [Violaceomyces palustris]|uniref:Uncharacterized protein n=1 Tax=Violaceomyces palustris TaxID=1673888 RepID=A0ACD0NTC4_9BASI|nr:hypothetical protein IE53DRAFT_168682 [Violaceomyces palustris]
MIKSLLAIQHQPIRTSFHLLSRSGSKAGPRHFSSSTKDGTDQARTQGTNIEDSSPSTTNLPKLRLYTGTDCQLCEVAWLEIQKARSKIAFEVEKYNIRDDSLEEVKHWRRKYQYDIPVLHLEGKEIFRHRFTEDQLLERLKSSIEGPSSE